MCAQNGVHKLCKFHPKMCTEMRADSAKLRIFHPPGGGDFYPNN
jgi:hypothetical protein